MTTEQLTERLVGVIGDVAAAREDIKTLFKQQETIRSLAESTNEVAKSVRVLSEKVNNVDRRMTSIEDEKNKKGFAVWQVVMSAGVSSVVTWLAASIV